MRIAVLTSLFPSEERPREGIFAERRWQVFAERGHEVLVVHPVPWTPPGLGGVKAEFRRMATHEERGLLTVHRPRYLHLPQRLGKWAATSSAVRFARAGQTHVEAHQPDAIVLDYAWPAAALVRLTKLPCVLSGRGSDVLAVAQDPRLAPQLAQALRDCAGYLAVSKDLVRAMDELSGHRGRGQLLENGVDTGQFAPGPKGPARVALGLGEPGTLVGTIGHLIPRKNPLLALDAFLEAAPKDARLVFAGRGELESELRQRVQTLGVDDRVQLLGELSPEKLALLYRALDVLLLTSSREGRPNVVLEAFASGTPVVATPAGGTPELFESPTGERVEPGLATGGSREAVAHALSQVLAQPPRGDLLRRTVEPRTWPACAERLESLLKTVLVGDSASRNHPAGD